MSKLYRVTKISHVFIVEKNEDKAIECANNHSYWTEDGIAIREANESEWKMLGFEYDDVVGCWKDSAGRCYK